MITIKKDKTIKYFIYCRKSSEDEDRQILSIDSQIEALKELSQKFGLKIIETFTESKSAKAPEREVFNKMIQRIEKGEAQGILCWKLDRLSRNPIDSGKISWLLQQGILKSIQTIDRQYLPDDNVLLFNVESGMANQYILDLSKNVKRGLKTKLQMGWYPSRAPLGYLNTIIKEKGANEIIKDPERFDTVRRMWNLMLTGNYTPPQIIKIADKEWKLKTRTTKRFLKRPLSRSQIYKIFTNPFYYGSFDYPRGSGNWYKGKQEPMITEEEFDRVQKLLGREGRPRPKEHRFAFTGLMRCGNCGAMITAEEKIKRQKNGNIHYYIYYHCTKRKDENCPEKMIELKDLTTKIDTLLKSLSISEKFKSWAIKYLHEIRQNEAQSNEVILENKQETLLQITKQLDNLLIKYTSPENESGQLITDQEYQALKSQFLNQKASLESELKTQGKTIEEWVELSERTFKFARYARIWFAKGDMDTKRAIFACLGSHLVIKDQKLNVELHPYFKVIFENLAEAERELIEVRTSESVVNKRQIAEILAKCLTLRWG